MRAIEQEFLQRSWNVHLDDFALWHVQKNRETLPAVPIEGKVQLLLFLLGLGYDGLRYMGRNQVVVGKFHGIGALSTGH